MNRRNGEERRLMNTILREWSLDSPEENLTSDLTLLYPNEICFYIKPAF